MDLQCVGSAVGGEREVEGREAEVGCKATAVGEEEDGPEANSASLDLPLRMVSRRNESTNDRRRSREEKKDLDLVGVAERAVEVDQDVVAVPEETEEVSLAERNLGGGDGRAEDLDGDKESGLKKE